jgi:hypothetical protein
LKGFFRDAESLIRNAVHKHFPTVLQVATAHRQRLDNQSPLSWTCAQITRQVCHFLGIDEQFDSASPLKDDCRLWIAAVRIASGAGWHPDDEIPADFALPGWVQYQWEMMRALSLSWPPAKDDTELLPALSPSDGIKWAKGNEFWMMKALERQIDGEIQEREGRKCSLIYQILTQYPFAHREAGKCMQSEIRVTPKLTPNFFWTLPVSLS